MYPLYITIMQATTKRATRRRKLTYGEITTLGTGLAKLAATYLDRNMRFAYDDVERLHALLNNASSVTVTTTEGTE